jgi:epoxyqueuosine reductase
VEQVRPAQHLPDFDVRQGWTRPRCCNPVGLGEPRFLQRSEGSPIRRIGWTALAAQPGGGAGQRLARGADPRWRRPCAAAAESRELVREHIDWALAQRADQA